MALLYLTDKDIGVQLCITQLCTLGNPRLQRLILRHKAVRANTYLILAVYRVVRIAVKYELNFGVVIDVEKTQYHP